MDINATNFESKLPYITESILQANFCSFDLEFTGLLTNPLLKECFLDTPQTRYLKLRKICSDVAMVQLGITTFHYDEEKKCWTYRPFNFYCLRKEMIDVALFCGETSSLVFLAKNKFDFNKLFTEGVSFVSAEDEQIIRENNAWKSSPQMSSSQIKVTKTEDIDFLSTTMATIEAFMSATTTSELSLPPCNAFRRRVLYENIPSKYSTLQISTTKLEGGEAYLVLMRASESSIAEMTALKEQERIASFNESLKSASGLRRVWDCICRSRVPVVGHNLLRDALIMYKSFETSLPYSLYEFSKNINQKLSTIIDTKFYATKHPVISFKGETMLEKAYALVKKECPLPEVRISDGHEDPYKLDIDSENLSVLKVHEAAYDSLLTGILFCKLAHAHDSNSDVNVPTMFITKFTEIINRIPMQGIRDVLRISPTPCVDSDINAHVTESSRVVYIENSSPSLTQDEIKAILANYGTDIFISYISSSTALIRLNVNNTAWGTDSDEDNISLAPIEVIPFAEGVMTIYSFRCYERMLMLAQGDGLTRTSLVPSTHLPPTSVESTLKRNQSHFEQCTDNDNSKRQKQST